ncbi:MAG: hypothetical protein ACI4WZ_01475 [Eubacteriales bacterium]
MKNEYKITKKEMMSWAKEFYLQGAKSIFSFILVCVIGIAGLFLLIISILTKGENWTFIFDSILFLTFFVYELLFSRFVFWSN